MTILDMLEMKKQLDSNYKKIKQLIAVFAGMIFLCTCWIVDLEDQNEMLMNKVTSMQIQVAKCDTP